ncbi:hypothetical protein ACHAWU_005498 [Discostella pseudostelligera]|uniref:Kinetochore protein SPC25 n=1 Tax=Discostella pseudostelligera TaxID=259834 RepID=A0ABD3MVU7_9STRA
MSSTMIYSGFTSGCLNRLETSRRKLNIFTDANKKRVDNILSDLQQLQSNEQQKIDSLLRQLKSLQYERGAVEKLKDSSSNNSADNGTGGGGGGCMAERRKKLESKQKKLEEEVSMLESRNRMEKQQLDEIMAEEAAVRKRADEVRKKKEEIEMARGITLEDLTIGLLNYRYTGLTFQTLQDGTLSFKFTKLDRNDPSRPFTFMLSTDENDQYMLSKVNPSISQTKTDAILDELNKDGTNGLNKFAIGMRKLFKEIVIE